jgi:hypothetical protein
MVLHREVGKRRAGKTFVENSELREISQKFEHRWRTAAREWIWDRVQEGWAGRERGKTKKLGSRKQK